MVDADCGLFGHCEPMSHTCVQCLVDAHCGPAGLVCDTAHGFICRVPCFNGMCGPLGFCEPTTNVCVECIMNSHCATNEVCDPNTLSCVECVTNADCALTPGQHICEPQSQQCVQCITNADCTAPEECLTINGQNFCTLPSGRGLCEPCSNDNQCGGPDDHCIGYLGPTGLFDRACSIDCAMSPMVCPSGFECISVRNGTAMQCRPRYEMNTPTCTATRNLTENCLVSMNDPDPGCGIDNTQDARCVYPSVTATVGVCTVWCLDNADCANGTTCVGAMPPNTTGNCL
jgi:Cys-rich repeat protein